MTYQILELVHIDGRWVQQARDATPEETAELDAQRNASPLVPQKVTRRQARQALLLAGLLDAVPTAIAAIADATQRSLAQIEWDDSLEFERTRPLLIQLAHALGLSDAQLDALFIQAANL